jgi:hypothetical protein
MVADLYRYSIIMRGYINCCVCVACSVNSEKRAVAGFRDVLLHFAGENYETHSGAVETTFFPYSDQRHYRCTNLLCTISLTTVKMHHSQNHIMRLTNSMVQWSEITFQAKAIN